MNEESRPARRLPDNNTARDPSGSCGQLTLDDELLEHDGLSFGAWVLSLPVGGRGERAWIDAYPVAAVRALNQVDRAVDGYRKRRAA